MQYVVTDAGLASHRVRLWQGGPASILTSLSGTLWYAVVRSSRVRAFLEYMAKHSLNFREEPLIPLGIEGDGWVCRLLYAVYQMLSLGPSTVTVR